jgi:NADH-quinone oxidoreductase subunit L
VVTDVKRVIAYSTMSQIGYMVMACRARRTAGLFHLMTHAFFKALLFMAAGSLISAMAGNQNLDDMGGFRRAMPFTFGCFIVGGLALSGFPPFSASSPRTRSSATWRRVTTGTSCSRCSASSARS